MSHVFPTYARWDISVATARGTVVTDEQGKSYLDFVSGIAVCNLGHCHPKVVQAVERQLHQVWHVSNLFQHKGQEKVAAKLVESSSGDLVFFANSGAEANEAAIKLARKHTGRSKIITFEQSFHGRTFATMSATGQKKIHEGFGPLVSTFVYLPFNDIAALEVALDDQTAAVMLEVVQGEGGVHEADPHFLEAVQRLCAKQGALLIVDEVQTGIGRTGKAFAYQHYQLSPDIITVAKGLGNGFPVGAMIGKNELKDSFGPGVHGSTFGGNPLAMAAAEAVLEEVFTTSFLDSVAAKGIQMKNLLVEQLKDNEWIKDIRGKGLLIGIELTVEAASFVKLLREKGLLVLTAGPNVLRLLPPLTVSEEEIERATTLVVDVINTESQ